MDEKIENFENNDEPDKKFDTKIMERCCVAKILKDKNFALQVCQFMKVNDWHKGGMFSDPKLQWIVNSLAGIYARSANNKMLANGMTETVFNYITDKTIAKKEKEVPENIKEFAKDLFENKDYEIDEDTVRRETVEIIKYNRAMKAIAHAFTQIQNKNFNVVPNILSTAVNISIDEDDGLEITDIKKSFDKARKPLEDTGLTYGSAKLDRALGGSPQKGELTIFAGLPGTGKSIILGDVAAKNALLGKNFIVISLEMSEERFCGRILRGLLDVTGDEFNTMTKEEAEQKLEANNPNQGRVFVKRYQSGLGCCNDFEAFINNIEEKNNIKIDGVCIDYVLITKPNDTEVDLNNIYLKGKKVSEDMRNLAIRKNIPVFSAVQLNKTAQDLKGGSNAVVGSASIAESRAILDTTDNLIIMQQTAAEKAEASTTGKGKMRLKVEKGRNSKFAGCETKVIVNYDKMTITDDSSVKVMRKI